MSQANMEEIKEEFIDSPFFSLDIKVFDP